MGEDPVTLIHTAVADIKCCVFALFREQTFQQRPLSDAAAAATALMGVWNQIKKKKIRLSSFIIVNRRCDFFLIFLILPLKITKNPTDFYSRLQVLQAENLAYKLTEHPSSLSLAHGVRLWQRMAGAILSSEVLPMSLSFHSGTDFFFSVPLAAVPFYKERSEQGFLYQNLLCSSPVCQQSPGFLGAVLQLCKWLL